MHETFILIHLLKLFFYNFDFFFTSVYALCNTLNLDVERNPKPIVLIADHSSHKYETSQEKNDVV